MVFDNFLNLIAKGDVKNLMQAQSIASQARENIFMYRVGISQSVGDVALVVSINKYIETMCGVFTLIVSGINPIASSNSEIKDIIKSISAEAFNPQKSIEHFNIAKSLQRMSVEYDVSSLGTERSPPRIGRNAFSTEAPTQILNPPPPHPSPTETKQWSVDYYRFSEKLEKLPGYPTILKLTFNVDGGTVTIPIAIKANPQAIGTEEMVMFMESVLSGRTFNFIRFFKWKSGEITTSQYIFGTDLAERDKKLYAKLGRNPIYIEFMKRKADSKFRGAINAMQTNKANTIGPTGSLVVTTDDLIHASKLDIRHFTKNNEFISRIMERTFIMCFSIVDLPMEMVSFYFMGYKEPFRLNFAELGVGKSLDPNKQLEQAILELSRKVA